MKSADPKNRYTELSTQFRLVYDGCFRGQRLSFFTEIPIKNKGKNRDAPKWYPVSVSWVMKNRGVKRSYVTPKIVFKISFTNLLSVTFCAEAAALIASMTAASK